MALQAVRLSSGHDMPLVGLGTWQAKSDEMEAVITSALDSGYRHIDTAFNYNNEEAIGKSLKKWFGQGGKREDLFITTKLPNFGNRPSDVEKFLNLSLQRLGLDYVDLYLVHMPFAFVKDENSFAPAQNKDGNFILDLQSDPVAVWKEMEKQVKAGRTKSIGLSNFNISQIQNILNNSEIKPSNLQVELHAYMQQRSLRDFCQENNISITGYSPIGSPGAKQHFQTKYNYSADKFPDLLGHSVVKKIASNHNKTTAQVLLRHAVQGGLIVIPKSSNPERIKSNIEIFDFALTDSEMDQLNALDQAEAGRIFNFLFFKGVERHPQYPFKSELELRSKKTVSFRKGAADRIVMKRSSSSFVLPATLCCVLISYTQNVEAGTVYRLSSGYNFPIVGLGTHGLNKDVLETVLTGALEKGIRHIDTSFVYKNEETIGKVLKDWFAKGGKREDIFVTSKLPYYDNHPESVEKYIKLSLEKLGLRYLDMYLIHAPFAVHHKEDSYELATNEDGSVVLDTQTDPIAAWKEMEKQVKEGRTKSIGLSNFNETQIRNILKEAKIKPSNLQVEVHAYHQQKPLIEFCQKNGIIVTGYAPLGSPGARKELHPGQTEEEFPDVFKLPVVNEIAKKHGKSVVQILLHHLVQNGIAVIFSSKNPNHLKENIEIFDFELTEDEMKSLDALDKGERGKIFDYKFLKGIEKHQYYPFSSAL
ncbi:hypothetical protein TSAR_011418 [Trichomalopsis sarcophagae]|uniref:NADP-dependent oxidoreductase domain-containing protein n=1 Tax=Trichomalopsis sarcophagae TaxID=543379 RepID=A0A232EVU0_9HYME|nr:hypothetical protein TSAR_011418 [Trichomalopsis sarcophagae]